MQNHYATLNCEKVKSFKAMRDLAKHCNRTNVSANVDRSLMFLNVGLVPCPSNMDKEWKRRLKLAECEHKKEITYKKDAVLALEIVTSMSHGADKDLNINSYEWAKKNLQWMCDTFGEENILGCTLHLDESTPHIHTEVIPITKDGRLCAKEFTGGGWKMSKMQTSYANAMSEFGLKRGKYNSKAKKKSLKKFYKKINYAEAVEPPKPLENETLEDYYERAKKYLRDAEMENLQLREENKDLKLNQEERIKDALSEYSDAISLQRALYVAFEDDKARVKDFLERLLDIVIKNSGSVLFKALSFVEDKLLPKYERQSEGSSNTVNEKDFNRNDITDGNNDLDDKDVEEDKEDKDDKDEEEFGIDLE